jgi:glycosyltransferase involved in cell wall biosynthesis
MYLSIVVPVFNEEESLLASYDRILSAFSGHDFKDKIIELVFVNDGSTDGTAGILASIENTPSAAMIKVIHFSRNFGHSAAVLAGLKYSCSELVAIIDADMQDPPELLPKMINKLDEGYDVVYGVRESRVGETLFKRITAWGFYRVINALASIDIPKDTGDFRVMTRQVVDALLECKDQAPFIRGLVAWVGFKQTPLSYHREERKFGSTKYPLKKMFKFAWQAISSFSNAPLMLIVYLGLLMSLISILIAVWALTQYFAGHVIQGWTSLLLGFLVGNSVTLLMLGIIGLYLGKVIDQVRTRPRYIVRSKS